MKFSTSSTIFCIFAYAFVPLVPNRSVLISASELPHTNSKNSLSGFSSVPTSSNAFDPSLALLGPSGGHLSLQGLDPNQPITEAEAVFLEATIREAFNAIHEEMGIDLVASSVDIARDMVVGDGDDEARHPSGSSGGGGNLRGRRKLSWTDVQHCEQCIFDLEFFMDCRSEDPMVQPRPYPQIDDVKEHDVPGPWIHPRPPPQVEDERDNDFLSPMVQPRPYPNIDDVKEHDVPGPWIHPRPPPKVEDEKDHDFLNPMVQPRPYPTIDDVKELDSQGPWTHPRPPPQVEDEKDHGIPGPWIHPRPPPQEDDEKDHDISGSWVHPLSAPKDEDEKELELLGPWIHPRPIPPPPKPHPIDWKILKKLKQGPFRRFHEVVKVHFKGGN